MYDFHSGVSQRSKKDIQDDKSYKTANNRDDRSRPPWKKSRQILDGFKQFFH